MKYVNVSEVECFCMPRQEDNPWTIRDLSEGCEATWCAPVGGPCGSLNKSSDDGYSLYCLLGTCSSLAQASSFYPDSPGQVITPIITTTTDTISLSTETTTDTTSMSTEMTTDTTSMSTEATTRTTSTETTTCPKCPGKYDKRGNYWNETCLGTTLSRSDFCPPDTQGKAIDGNCKLWKCGIYMWDFCACTEICVHGA